MSTLPKFIICKPVNLRRSISFFCLKYSVSLNMLPFLHSNASMLFA